MKELLAAIELRHKYNRMPLEEVVKEFETYSKQVISKEIVNKFKFLGLNNVDFLTCDFLNKYGLKNLYQATK